MRPVDRHLASSLEKHAAVQRIRSLFPLPCATLIATIQSPGIDAPVHFVNHFPTWKPQQEAEREQQAVQAAGRLEPLTGHIIVAGDFDADPDAASLRFWTGR